MPHFLLSKISRKFEALLIAAACGAVSVHAQPDAVLLTPAVVQAGSPELIHVDAPASATVGGEWMGHTLEFFQTGDARGWFALVGVDVETKSGPSPLRITEKLENSDTRDLSRTVNVLAAHYRTETITVAPQFVEPPASAIAEIKTEVALKEKVFTASAPVPLWSGDFRVPVSAAPTDSFGTRRTYNGTLAGIHKGMDFRAHMGTPIHASNAAWWCWRASSTSRETASPSITGSGSIPSPCT